MSFVNTKLKVVGIVKSPLYISRDRGTTTLGSGKISYFMYVPKENINSESYTEVDIIAKNAKDMNYISDKYNDYIEDIKNEIENLYFAWNTAILDLHKLNVNSNDILGFSSSLDTATNYIKNEDKQNSLLAVANLYAYLPKYMESVSNDTVKKNILQTKSNDGYRMWK